MYVHLFGMRIIAGTKRGMKLLSPKTDASRPITDRVKESLFNVLYKYDLPNEKVADAPRDSAEAAMPLARRRKLWRRSVVADLFCGVGSLGLEALSRGAEFVTFVEQDPKVAAVLERNIEKAGFVKESKVIRANAFKTGASVSERRYDLIFIDPPYANTSDVEIDSPLGRLLSSVSERLIENGIVVVRTERRTELLKGYGLLEIIERRQWGTMAVTILQKKDNDQ